MTGTAKATENPRPWRRTLRLAARLTKLRLSAMVLVTAGAGYGLAGGGHGWAYLAATLLGTALTCFGAMALNEWWEVELDARMERTRGRPLVTGEFALRTGLWTGLGLAAAGVSILGLLVNLLTAAIGLAIVALYLLVYTPLKTRSSLCTLVGAVCGGLPPLMGWTAARSELGYGGLTLAALLFFWQIPHFLALAWIYREDYARAGFRMLSLGDPSGRHTSRTAAIYALALVPVSLLLLPVAAAGPVYMVGALLLGGALASITLRWAASRSLAHARLVFRTTLVYLPLLLALLLATAAPRPAPVDTVAVSLPAPPGLLPSLTARE